MHKDKPLHHGRGALCAAMALLIGSNRLRLTSENPAQERVSPLHRGDRALCSHSTLSWACWMRILRRLWVMLVKWHFLVFHLCPSFMATEKERNKTTSDPAKLSSFETDKFTLIGHTLSYTRMEILPSISVFTTDTKIISSTIKLRRLICTSWCNWQEEKVNICISFQ